MTAFEFIQTKFKGNIHRSTHISIDIITLEKWLDEYLVVDAILIGEPFRQAGKVEMIPDNVEILQNHKKEDERLEQISQEIADMPEEEFIKRTEWMSKLYKPNEP